MKTIARSPGDGFFWKGRVRTTMQTIHMGGAEIPALGYGTYGMSAVDLHQVLPAALRAGFRHIDTAQVYRNEAAVGECIAASGLPRSQLFITTKTWVGNYRRELFDAGKVRHIGVSNYNSALLRSAVSLSHHPLVTHQFEYHPYLNQRTLIESTRSLGMVVTAYCAMAIGRVFAEPVLKEIAAARGRSVAQVVLRWLIQQPGTVALSRTTDPQRVAENVAVFDFDLTSEELERIHALAQPRSRIVDPPGLAPVWDSTG
jgi:diketogulonate reductase-like aldo/keto reductase